jgi:hypothetical protein
LGDTLSSAVLQIVCQRRQALSVSEFDNFVTMDMLLKLHYALDVGDQWQSLGMMEECKHEEQRARPV